MNALQRKSALMKQSALAQQQQSTLENSLKVDLSEVDLLSRESSEIATLLCLKKCAIKPLTNKVLFDDIDITNFTIGSSIGKGSYAVVKSCHPKSQHDWKLAVKTYEKFRLKEPQKMKNLQREITILRLIKHPNILRLLFSIEDRRQVHLITEHVEGDLMGMVKKSEHKRLEEGVASRLFRQVVQAVGHLHSHQIIHRDIKMENILVDSTGHVKLIDFGFAIQVPEGKKMEIYCGTPQCMSPQIIRQQPFDGKAADVWALGIVLFHLTHGRFPFKALTEKELYRMILTGSFQFDPHASSLLRDLLMSIFALEDTRRSTAQDILAHPWF